MHTAGEVCKAFLEAMRPVNTYVDHYVAMLKADYEYERVCRPPSPSPGCAAARTSPQLPQSQFGQHAKTRDSKYSVCFWCSFFPPSADPSEDIGCRGVHDIDILCGCPLPPPPPTAVSSCYPSPFQSHLLRRLSYNDEWDRFRLENEGLSYFGMKMVCVLPVPSPMAHVDGGLVPKEAFQLGLTQ